MPTSPRTTALLENRCLPCLKGGGPTEGWWRDSVRGNRFDYHKVGAGRRDTWVPPYDGNFCRAGPACPAVRWGKRIPQSASPTAPFRQGGQHCRGGRPCPPAGFAPHSLQKALSLRGRNASVAIRNLCGDDPSGASRHLPLHRGGFFRWLPCVRRAFICVGRKNCPFFF